MSEHLDKMFCALKQYIRVVRMQEPRICPVCAKRAFLEALEDAKVGELGWRKTGLADEETFDQFFKLAWEKSLETN